MNRHAWLQKHPSPSATRGEFHWYPDAGDRELRASMVERVRGLEPPAVLWQLEPGRVAWAQVFAATTPLDGRRYVGLVLSVVEADRPIAELLARLNPPPAAPWSPAVDGAADLAGLAPLSRGMRGDAAAVARGLLTGGSATVDDPTDPELPRWLASIERLLPDLRATRCGAWRAADLAAASAGGTQRPRDRVAELVAAAWREPGSPAARAWLLLCELAAARGESIDQVGLALEAIDAGAALTAAERADVVGCERVVDVLQAWGRGRLDRSQTAGTLTARLADLVALRVLAGLATGDDGRSAIAEARWYALLPAPRRTALLAAVAQRTASLRTFVEEVYDA